MPVAFITDPNVWKPAFEIGIIFLMFYGLLRFMKGTRGEGIFKGFATSLLTVVVLLLYVSSKWELPRLGFLLNAFLRISVIALIILFQPELRRGLTKLGDNPFIGIIVKSSVNVLDEVIDAVVRLSKNKVGALIAIERETGLRDYIEGGVRLDGEVRAELIETIFYPGSPLHDGAIILQDTRVAAAGCLFPLTDDPSISKTIGTRHRAAIGLTEETDAITVVVSEETGTISVGYEGRLVRNLDREGLESLLRQLYLSEEAEEEQKTGQAA